MNTKTTDAATVQLRDGRILSYAVHGAPDGSWVLYNHGTGSSRLEGALFDEVAREQGLRILTIDRPSYGRSTPQENRTLPVWAADVAEVVDQLRINRFAVLGMSGGGPHALALAAVMPDRVSHAVIINSGGPTSDPEVLAKASKRDRKVWLMARDNPQRFLKTVSPLMSRKPGKLSELLVKSLIPKLDQQLIAQPHVREVLEASGEEGRRQAGRRFDEALLIWGSDWGFDPYNFDPPVVVFSGEEDPGRAYNQKLGSQPGARLESFPGGHLAFLADDVMARIGAALKAA